MMPYVEGRWTMGVQSFPGDTFVQEVHRAREHQAMNLHHDGSRSAKQGDDGALDGGLAVPMLMHSARSRFGNEAEQRECT